MNIHPLPSLLTSALLSLAAWQAGATGLAGSGDPFTFNFDENGNGTIDLRNLTGLSPNNGSLKPDPTQPGNPLVLTYLLPPGPNGMVNGDVRVWENAAATNLSDVLRFTDAAGNLTGRTADRMILYSAPLAPTQPGPPDLADTGFPALLRPNDGGGIVEVGPVGDTSFQWAPGGALDNIFNGISDVPEPGVAALLALGLGSWLGARRRHNQSERARPRAQQAWNTPKTPSFVVLAGVSAPGDGRAPGALPRCAPLVLTLLAFQLGSAKICAQATYAPYTFGTFAGQAGAVGSTDDTGNAARFNNPQSLGVDPGTNVYVADTANHTLRKLTPSAVVTTLAGLAGSSGTADGTGSDARFNNPGGVAVDNRTNIYVADTGNHTIRVVTAAGVVTTLAGSAGSSGTADGTGTGAQFNAPAAVAVDGAGNVYVADTGNNTIRMVTPAGLVTTLAGSAGNSGVTDGTGTNALFNAPAGIAVDSATNVYVADTGNHTIRKLTPAGVVSTIAGSAGTTGANDGLGVVLAGSSLLPARFNSPAGLAVDAAGYLYIADTGNDTVRRLSPAGVVNTLAGSAGTAGANDGTGRNAQFNLPRGIALDRARKLWVADTANATIRAGNAAIEHVVLVMMENRSFDHFLGWLPVADGKQAGLTYNDSTGKAFATYPLAPYFQGCGCEDPDHSYGGGRVEYNNGACDGWLRTNDVFSIGYYVQDDLSFFGVIAPHWTVCDRYFAAIMAETQPNRIYQHAAQTDAVTNRTAEGIKQLTNFVNLPTIWDTLAQNGVKGTYYYAGNYASGGSVRGLWGTKYFFADTPLNGSKFSNGFFNDCSGGTLPAVAFVDPVLTADDAKPGNDDHPYGDVRDGEAFLASIYNAIASSATWSNTVFIINFDEWGGFFDHVPPPQVEVAQAEQAFNDGRLGFRVPCLVISPWARKAYVSSEQFDHTSVLKMIENLWGLRPLTVRDANANDLADVLDLTSPDFSRPQQLNVPAGPFAGPTNNTVQISKQRNGDLVLSWRTLCPKMQLQSAPALAGPWTDVAVVDPPYTVPAPQPAARTFYRLRAK